TSWDPARVAGAGGLATRAVSVACSGDVGNGDLPAQGRLDTSDLGRTTPTPLVRDDPAVDEQLAAPHAPRLLTGQGRVEALRAHGALRAKRLRPRDVSDVLREEQVGERSRAVAAARVDPPEVFGVLGGLEDDEHLGLLRPGCFVGLSGRTRTSRRAGVAARKYKRAAGVPRRPGCLA